MQPRFHSLLKNLVHDNKRQKTLGGLSQEKLPIFPFKKQILDFLVDSQVLILIAATGSGKTTQLPQYILRELNPSKKIIVTQPRKIAAINMSKRVADELGVPLGNLVGYSVRFEDLTSKETRIKFTTDGILFREFIFSPSLNEYEYVIIDEAHERSLCSDLIMSLLKELLKLRMDLRVIITSATLDFLKMAKFFGAKILKIPGQPYEVDLYFTKEPQTNYLESLFSLIQSLLPSIDGNMLIFLTGFEDISVSVSIIRKIVEMANTAQKYLVLPLHSSLSSEQQEEVFKLHSKKIIKIILATNIAETSITIDGIKFVVDCGLCKLSAYDPRAKIKFLTLLPCSKSSARQRSGRSGRTSGGVCYRLYTEQSFLREMPESTQAEIVRTDFTSPLLVLKSMGIDNIAQFPFFQAPPSETILSAYEVLNKIEAIDREGHLTPHGKILSLLPLEPILSNIIIRSLGSNCFLDVLALVALTSVGQSLLFMGKTFKDLSPELISQTGDHEIILNIWKYWFINDNSKDWCKKNHIHHRHLVTAKNIFDQIYKLCQKFDLLKFDNVKQSDFISILAESNPFNIGIRKGNKYIVGSSIQADIHPSSCLAQKKPERVIFSEIFVANSTFINFVSSLD